MTTNTTWRRISVFLRSRPWLVAGIYKIWRVFQTKYTLGVVGVVLNERDEILLVEHVFHPRKPWGLPGGWVHGTEDPALAVEREFQEELALTVRSGPVLLAEFNHGKHLDLAFLCHAEGAIGKLSFELLAHGWFSIHEIPVVPDFHIRAIQRAFEVKQNFGTVQS